MRGEETASGERSKAFETLYGKLLELVGSGLVDFYYDAGYESYRAEDYEQAIPNLRKAWQYDQEKAKRFFIWLTAITGVTIRIRQKKLMRL